MPRREELQDAQWTLIEPLLSKVEPRSDGRGRPRCDDRSVMNGILWILRSGARWKDLPDRFPSYQTCHRRFQQWIMDGSLTQILNTLAEDLRKRGEIDVEECFIDGSFASAKKGAVELGKLSGARVRSSWQWQTALVYQAPLTWFLRHPMKSLSSSQRSQMDSLLSDLED